MRYIPPELRGPMKQGNPWGPLDAVRQARRDLLLALRADGLSYARIGKELGISVESVRRGILKARAQAARAA